MTIELSPSPDTNALTEAIKNATITNQKLVLLPGIHLTKPGQGLRIPIGPNGLTLTGSAKAQIKRPNNSIGKVGPDNPNAGKDFNFGIFLVPAGPSPEELEGAQWRRHEPPGKEPFEYIIIMRGDVSLSGVLLNCNMGNQGVSKEDQKHYQHSSMLAIAGFKYKAGISPKNLKRFVFVGFNDVRLNDLTTINGGFSDDISFLSGGFRPNISNVRLFNLVSRGRVSPIRASVGFSGLGQRVAIDDCQFDDLHVEADSPWRELPGPAGLPIEESSWLVGRLQAADMLFSVKDDALELTGSQLTVTRQFAIELAAGSLRDCRLALSGKDNNRFIGLRDFLFRGCTWVSRPDAKKNVKGLRLFSDARPNRRSHPFKADFVDNSFVVEGSFETGQLITTNADAGNNTVRFINCKYQAGFGTAGRPIAILSQRGKYSFKKTDLAGLDPKQAIRAPNAIQTRQGDFIVYTIP